jgi:glycosyltransferase involved in cell wall biosynthesis
MGHPITRASLGLTDPLRIARLGSAIERSNRHLSALVRRADGRVPVDAIVVDALGNDFARSAYDGRANVARCVFENADPGPRHAALGAYDAVTVVSSWNADLVEAATGRRPHVIHEGVDPSLFCPGPRSGLLPADRFHVFSGGKVELRKGQDLVLQAFGAFRASHPDAVLVTAWQSIWPAMSHGFRGRLSSPVAADANGMLDIRGWAFRNGVDPAAIVDLGLVPNALMPLVLREMDVCLQPSRAEGGTNLPAKEVMACEVPLIAAANTGMRDVLTDDNAIVLKRQRPVGDDRATDGWGESDVDEIIAALEFAYERRDEARAIGRRGRAWLLDHDRTWQAHARLLKEWILTLR